LAIEALLLDQFTDYSENPCMTYSSTLTSKNQTTLPKAIALLLGVRPQAMLSYEVTEEGKVLLSAKSATFKDIADSFPKRKPAKPVTVEAMRKAVATGAAKRFKKSAK
jgi:bifunctional DNA-binding transcriptional regulator/antitoxin component of YhaV-PrlF toxin-antitoxin module